MCYTKLSFDGRRFVMKKLLGWLAALSAVSALLVFVFYFFKVNPRYCPFCKEDSEDEDFAD